MQVANKRLAAAQQTRMNLIETGLVLAEELGLEVRLLPMATPELNAMDTLWKLTKREALGDRESVTIYGSALAACQHFIDLSPQDRLHQAGILSGNVWLTS